MTEKNVKTIPYYYYILTNTQTVTSSTQIKNRQKQTYSENIRHKTKYEKSIKLSFAFIYGVLFCAFAFLQTYTFSFSRLNDTE